MSSHSLARVVTATSVLLSALAIAPNAVSQDQTEQSSAQLGRFTVTGSHITRLDLEGITPVQTISRDDIERTGVMTVGELLTQLPMDNGGTFNDQANNTFAAGGTSVSFRGLGANTVLVLINGRRATNYGFANRFATFVSFVDLNSIPLGIVERVEILKDGASAIYGSDAIAGVINVILRDDVDGIEVDMRAGQSTDPGADEIAVNAVFGASNARSSATLMGSYTSRDKMFLRDRELSQSADFSPLGGFDFLSYRAANDVDFFPLPGDGCDVRPNTITDIFGTCAYNYNAVESIPGAQRTSFTGLFTHDLGGDLEFRAEIGFMNAISDNVVGPPTIDDNDDLLAPSTNPWNVGGIDYFDFWYRLEDVGARTSEVETDNVRAVFELSGSVFDGEWDWQVGTVYNRAVTIDNQDNYANKILMQQALANGIDVNGDGSITMNEYYNIWTPVSNPIDPALTAALRARPFRRAETELKAFDGNISGPIADLPAGTMSLAVGFEYRDERLVDRSDAASEANLILGSGGVSSQGSRSQSSIYGELSIPITDTFEAQVAARYEDYDGFGSQTNPKLAAMWRPNDWMLVRGSWGEGFRAPSLAELFLGLSVSFQNYVDQTRCPVTLTIFDCVLDKQLDTTGNALLNPETSESFSLGVVIEVPMVDNLTVALDYWSFDHENLISDIDVNEIMDREADCFNGLPTCDMELASLVTRTDPTPVDLLFGLPGTISTVRSPFLNLSEQSTDGFDLEVNYVLETSTWGTFTFNSYITYVNDFDFALLPTDPLEKIVGQYLQPEMRANSDVTWEYGDYRVGVFNRHIGRHDQQEDFAFFNDQEGARISSHTEWDLRFDYSGFDMLTLTVGVENVANEDIPLDWFETLGYSTALYNNRGRFFYTQVGLSF